ncbi:molybdopterin molybdotransferase [Nocardioides sp. J9]|uniref:molybdopterin molybdotransferase MoeA n=1 Tax=unclassified Nocardioides TaxID=2615069 RepID=UPI00048C94F8|nr:MULTISPECIES: gephyrin-like molybdotransferase Glp [unclassified Nocardioides]TWG99576.1 molybdopterin molybdotransferase [Nocardioides sp. J9]
MSTAALRSVTDHQDHVAALLARPGGPGDWPTERVPLADAGGRVLAEPVRAGEPLPAFDNSGMDGYAVRAAEVAGATPESPVRLPVAGDVPAGAPVGELAPGTTVRIMTGAPVPRGADAVVEVEVTDGGTETVAITAERAAGTFVRRAGSDVAVGDEVLAAGALLGAAQVGVLAALGVRDVVVRRRPRVLVVSTGSELAEEPVPGSGQIRDANGALLATAVEDAGGVAVRKLWVEDDVPTFLALLDGELASGEVDLVLTSGGVSAGAYEVVKDGLGPRGVEFVKVAMQPGMPQGSGVVSGVPVVCLPGNPVSALTSFEVFVRPALRAAFGHPVPHRPVVRARLTEPLTPLPAKRQWRRARLDRVEGTVTPWGPPGSAFLGWFAGADALIDVKPGTTALAAGDTVDVWDVANP